MPASSRRVFLVAFVACWAVGASWAAASPPFSGPDETAHVLRSYGAGRGELIGPDGGSRPGIIGETTLVEVPRSLGDISEAMACFIFQETVPAGCATSVEPGDGSAVYVSTAGRTPPLYYLVVSGPLNAFPRLLGLYLARLVGAGMAAALLAGAVTVCVARGLRATLAGAFLACTPMVWFLGGVVNPSSLEIAGAIAAWAGGAAILHDWGRDAPAGRGAVALLAAGGAGLALARSLGPLWVAVIGGTLLLLAWNAGTVRRVLQDRGAQVAAGVVALAAAANLAWVFGAGSLASDGQVRNASFPGAVSISIGRQFGMWRSVFANFGYLDTRPPDGVSVMWIACCFAVLVLAFSTLRRNERLILLALIGVVAALPVAVEASQYNELGGVWQGRYTLPLLVGVPILCGWAIDRCRGAVVPIFTSVLTTSVLVVTAAHGMAYWFAIRRYVVGTNGPVWFLGDESWLTWKLPPVTFGGLAVIAALGGGAIALIRSTPLTEPVEQYAASP